MARTALVGLTTYQSEVPWGSRRRPVSFTPAPYYDLVAEAGGQPLLLPSGAAVDRTDAAADAVISALDALVVIGGIDVDPEAYGADRHERTGTTSELRDRSELALVRAALRADLPVLAICRGHQVLNVARGGTLTQHVPDLLGHDQHQPGWGEYSTLEVETVPGSRTAAIFGERPTVHCSHHQVLDRLGDGLVVTATSIEPPGVASIIEAVELPEARFCVGVQWHPEDQGDLRPFQALLDA